MGKIEIEKDGCVLIGRIDNPPDGLMDRGTVDDLVTLVDRAEAEDDVTAVVLTGTHPERFIGHYDVAEILAGVEASPAVGRGAASGSLAAVRFASMVPGMKDRLGDSLAAGLIEIQRFHGTMVRMNRCGAVFIAAINGSTQGGGSELSLACDLRLMASGGVIGQPEILLGFPPGGGGTQRLARLVGSGRALQVTLDGTPIKAERALELGYVDELVEPGKLLERALEQARRLGNRPKHAIAATKRAVYFGGSLSLEAGLRYEQAEFLAAAGHPDAAAAMRGYVAQYERTGRLPAYDEQAMAKIDAEGAASLADG